MERGTFRWHHTRRNLSITWVWLFLTTHGMKYGITAKTGEIILKYFILSLSISCLTTLVICIPRAKITSYYAVLFLYHVKGQLARHTRAS